MYLFQILQPKKTLLNFFCKIRAEIEIFLSRISESFKVMSFFGLVFFALLTAWLFTASNCFFFLHGFLRMSFTRNKIMKILIDLVFYFFLQTLFSTEELCVFAVC